MTNQVQKKQLPAFLVLTIICLVAALALAVTNAVTEGPIKEHAMAAQREAFGAVMAADEYNEMTIPEGSGVSALVEAKKDGQTVGYCVVASQSGYAGPVAVTLGVDTEGKVTGAKIGDTSFAETSGFGSRWLAENQTEQFVGIDVKEGGAIEALSGATVTSTAVLNASNTALSTVAGVLGVEAADPVLVFGVAEKKPVEQMALTGDIHEGSAKGFASDVKVQLTMDAAGAITGLAIESSGETAGFGTRCMEDPAFAEQFVGKTAPFAIGENIDALAGATVTSTAVVAAVNAAVEAPANPDAVPFGAGSEEEPAVEAAAEALPEGAKTASAKGLLSEVKVVATFNADGTIATLTVDASGETAAIATPCTEEAFLSQFIGKAGPFEGVEVVAGATFTSNAVIEAVNSLFAAEEGLTASAKGLLSDVKVTVTLNEDGTIATMVVDASGETAAIATPCTEEAFLSQFIGKAGPFEGVEVVAGATFTSNAVITAVNSLFPAEEAANEQAPSAEQMTASAPGFNGADVGVTITLDAEGNITAVEIDNSKQVPPVCDMVVNDDFLNQFIGKKGPFTADVVAGATFTSQGVIDAINSMFPTQDMSVAGEELPIAEAPAAEELTASAKGLLSDVKVTVTLNEDGTIATMTVDASGETAAIAGPCTEEAFLSQFIGKKGPFTADVVAGATFTSNAVINAVNSLFPAEEAAPAGEEKTGKAQGFQSEVTVTLTVADGVITGIKVDSTGETTGFGTRCGEDEAFLNQFIGKKATPDLGEGIEALSGATVTSGAVVEAANAAIGVAVEEVELPAELTASAKGLLSDVKVTVTLNADGTIATMVVDASGETAAIATPCTEEAFLSQFVGKAGPFESFDAVAGATFTSTAVFNAVNSLFAK